METLLHWGLDCIRLIQTGASPSLTALMRAMTTLGSPAAYIIILPFIYWCLDEKKALRLGTMVLISAWVNMFLKFTLNQPRPFFDGYDPSVGMIIETMGGFPSGHAQNTLVMWGIIALWVNKKWLWGAAALFCLLIGFSRVYLGVHFPTDIAGGWIIGGILLGMYVFAGKWIEERLAAHGPRAGLITCAALSFMMILYRPSVEIIMPGGMLLGLGTGFYLCRQYIGLNAAGLFGRVGAARYVTLLARFVVGITGLTALYIVLGNITHNFAYSDNYHLFVFLRYTVIALWISAGAPWVFRLFRLAESA